MMTTRRTVDSRFCASSQRQPFQAAAYHILPCSCQTRTSIVELGMSEPPKFNNCGDP